MIQSSPNVFLFFHLFTGAIGIFLGLIIFFQKTKSYYLNTFIVVIFLLFGFRIIINQFISSDNIEVITQIKEPLHLLFLGGFNIFYFYIRSLVRGYERLSWNDLYYFLPSVILIAINYLILFYFPNFRVEKNVLNLLTIFSLHSFIIYKTITILKNSIWNRKEIKQYPNPELLKKWVVFCVSIFILLSMKFYTSINLNDFSSNDLRNSNLTFVNSLFFLILVIIVLSSPKLFYGDKRLKLAVIDSSLSKSHINFGKLWLKKPKTIVNEQDQLLNVRIGAIMERISSKISVNDFDSNLFRNPDFEVSEFAKDLGFPKSHVYFLFKYYSKISFVEFRTMVRINLAITEIDNGYIQENTMESLAITIGFSSYNPFFNGFKKHLGISPKKYQLQEVKKINTSLSSILE